MIVFSKQDAKKVVYGIATPHVYPNVISVDNVIPYECRSMGANNR